MLLSHFPLNCRPHPHNTLDTLLKTTPIDSCHGNTPHPHLIDSKTKQVVLVEEVPEQPNTVELVIRVRLVELLQDTQLLQARLVHHLVVTDDPDGHFLVPLQGVASTHHIAEHPLPRVVQLLPDTHTWRDRSSLGT